MAKVFVGHDWSEAHHDLYVEDADGRGLARGRAAEGVEGLARFHELVAAFVEDPSEVLVATETGMLHQLRRANPAVRWEPVNPGAVCRFMKMTTPAALLRCLREGVTEVTVEPGVARRAAPRGSERCLCVYSTHCV